MSEYASINDLSARWRALTLEEQGRAEVMLEDAENALRVYAYDRGIDLDEVMHYDEPRARLLTAILCDIVKREMCANNDDPALSQVSQSGLGYSVSGTFLTPGGGLFIKNAELKMLGLLKQRARGIQLYD